MENKLDVEKKIKIRIIYYRKVQFDKTIEVTESEADRALELNDSSWIKMTNSTDDDYHFIAEDLTDTDDVSDYGQEIEDLEVTEIE